MASKQKKLSDQMREAIDASGLSRYRICKTIGLAQSVLSRFMAGTCGLSVESLDKIADVIGVRIAVVKKTRTGKGR